MSTDPLLPELWAQILDWLAAFISEDGIARARCRLVCRAWRDRDAAFVVPMTPGLASLIRFSLVPVVAREIISLLLVHFAALPSGFVVHSFWISTGREISVHIGSDKCHEMRVIAEWPGLLRDIYPGRLFYTMDWVCVSGYDWSALDTTLQRAIAAYNKDPRYESKSKCICPPCFHVA